MLRLFVTSLVDVRAYVADRAAVNSGTVAVIACMHCIYEFMHAPWPRMLTSPLITTPSLLLFVTCGVSSKSSSNMFLLLFVPCCNMLCHLFKSMNFAV